MGVFYKVFGLMVALGLLGSGALFSGCGPSDSADRGAGAPVESAAQAVMAMTSAKKFGASGLGTNYTCGIHDGSGTCVCDTTPGTGKTGPRSADCEDLWLSGLCTGGLGPDSCHDVGGRIVCTCDADGGGSPGCGGDPNCRIASWVLATGRWLIPFDKTYVRLPGWDRMCHLLPQQWNDLGQPSVNVASTQQQRDYINATYSGQDCSGVEAGLWTNSFADYHYRAPNGAIYKKWGYRACYETWHFFHDIEHDPANLAQLNQAQTDDLLKRYGTYGVVLPCDDVRDK